MARGEGVGEGEGESKSSRVSEREIKHWRFSIRICWP